MASDLKMLGELLAATQSATLTFSQPAAALSSSPSSSSSSPPFSLGADPAGQITPDIGFYLLQTEIRDKLYAACQAMQNVLSNEIEFIEGAEIQITNGYAQCILPNRFLLTHSVRDLGKKAELSLLKQMARDGMKEALQDDFNLFSSILAFLDKENKYALDIIFYVLKDELEKRTKLHKGNDVRKDVIINFLKNRVSKLEKCLSKDFIDFSKTVRFKTIVDLEQLEEVGIKKQKMGKKEIKKLAKRKQHIKQLIQAHRHARYFFTFWEDSNNVCELVEQMENIPTLVFEVECNSFLDECLKYSGKFDALFSEIVPEKLPTVSDDSSHVEVLQNLHANRVLYAKLSENRENYKELVAWSKEIKTFLENFSKKHKATMEKSKQVEELRKAEILLDNPLTVGWVEQHNSIMSGFKDFIKKCSTLETRKGTLNYDEALEKLDQFYDLFNTMYLTMESHVKKQEALAKQSEAAQLQAQQDAKEALEEKIKAEQIKAKSELEDYRQKTQLKLTQYRDQVSEEAARRKQLKKEELKRKEITRKVEQAKFQREYLCKRKQQETKLREETIVLFNQEKLKLYQALLEQIFAQPTPHYVIPYQAVGNLILALGGVVRKPGHGGSHRTLKLLGGIAYCGVLSNLEGNEDGQLLLQEQTSGVAAAHNKPGVPNGMLSRYDVKNIRALLESRGITPTLYYTAPAASVSSELVPHTRLN